MEDPQATQNPRQLAGVSPVSNLCTALGVASTVAVSSPKPIIFTALARGNTGAWLERNGMLDSRLRQKVARQHVRPETNHGFDFH